jgi:hypothetical protein
MARFVPYLYHWQNFARWPADFFPYQPNWSDASPERVHWEWRKVKRSFGDKKRKEFIEELQYWNSGLKAIVEKAEIPCPHEDEDSPVKKIQARLGLQQCDKIRESLGLMYQAFHKAGWACRCPEHRAVIRLGWHMEKTGGAVGGFDVDFAGLPACPAWQLISIKIEETEEADGLMPPTPSRSPSPSNSESKEKSKKWFPLLHRRKEQKGSTGDLQVPPGRLTAIYQLKAVC